MLKDTASIKRYRKDNDRSRCYRSSFRHPAWRTHTGVPTKQAQKNNGRPTLYTHPRPKVSHPIGNIVRHVKPQVHMRQFVSYVKFYTIIETEDFPEKQKARDEDKTNPTTFSRISRVAPDGLNSLRHSISRNKYVVLDNVINMLWHGCMKACI